MVYNLPGQLTRFIGRERELAEILQLLSVARLVTVTGPGGVGKTSLALQAASKVYDRFTDGVSCISLGPIRDPTLIIREYARINTNELAGISRACVDQRIQRRPCSTITAWARCAY